MDFSLLWFNRELYLDGLRSTVLLSPAAIGTGSGT